jgi:hypothetical protein
MAQRSAKLEQTENVPKHPNHAVDLRGMLNKVTEFAVVLGDRFKMPNLMGTVEISDDILQFRTFPGLGIAVFSSSDPGTLLHVAWNELPNEPASLFCCRFPIHYFSHLNSLTEQLHQLLIGWLC